MAMVEAEVVVVVEVDALLPSHSLSSMYLKKVMENSLKNSIEAFPATTKHQKQTPRQ